MAVGDAHMFPGFLTLVLTQLSFPRPPTTFLTCFCRGERRKNTGKKSRFNQGSNLQPPGQESDTLTTEPPIWGFKRFVLQTCAKKGLFAKGLTKTCVDEEWNMTTKFKFDLLNVENIDGKGENRGNKHFLFFPLFSPLRKSLYR